MQKVRGWVLVEDLLEPGTRVRRLHLDVKLSLTWTLKSPLTRNRVQRVLMHDMPQAQTVWI